MPFLASWHPGSRELEGCFSDVIQCQSWSVKLREVKSIHSVESTKQIYRTDRSWGEEWSHRLQRWPGDWVSHGYCLLEPEWRDAWQPVTTSDSMPFWPVILYVTKNHTENITQRRLRWTLIKMPVCIEDVCCCLAHFLILLFEIVHDPLTWRMKAAFL